MTDEYKVPIPWKQITGSIVALIMLIIISIQKFPFYGTLAIYLLGSIVGGWYFYEETIEAIFEKHHVNIDVIMTIAIVGSAVLGAFEESLTIVFLYSVTETLEAYTKKRTRTAIRSLMNLVPKTAVKLVNGGEQVIKVEEIQVKDRLLVKPGDNIPVDGRIVEGTALIDEASITGESVPVTKTVEDKVMGGTIVSDGVITIEVEKSLSESTVARVVSLVEEAQSKKTPEQLIVSRFTRWYNPFIIVLGFAVFVIPTLFFAAPMDVQFRLTITVMVAAAPCALAISTPVTVSAAIGSAGKKGILAKGGVSIQTLGEINAIAFDKTGTLTHGTLELKDIKIESDMSREEVIDIAASLEKFAHHPVARSILDEHKKLGSELREVEDFKSVPGFGVEGNIRSKRYYIGNAKYVENKLKMSPDDSGSKSIAFLFDDEKLIAVFTFDDRIKEEAHEAIAMLRKKKIEVYMLTGDKKETAYKIADDIGIDRDHVFAELTPEMKMQRVSELQKEHKLAMVGDGINDAPALALADLGIAIGTTGTDVALETADVAIMNDNLVNLVHSIDYGKKMKQVIYQNLVFSIIVLFGAIIGVVAGVLNLTETILIHEGSELLIVANAIRLLMGYKVVR